MLTLPKLQILIAISCNFLRFVYDLELKRVLFDKQPQRVNRKTLFYNEIMVYFSLNYIDLHLLFTSVIILANFIHTKIYVKSRYYYFFKNLRVLVEPFFQINSLNSNYLNLVPNCHAIEILGLILCKIVGKQKTIRIGYSQSHCCLF